MDDFRPNSWAEVTFKGLSSRLEHLAQANLAQGGDGFQMFSHDHYHGPSGPVAMVGVFYFSIDFVFFLYIGDM